MFLTRERDLLNLKTLIFAPGPLGVYALLHQGRRVLVAGVRKWNPDVEGAAFFSMWLEANLSSVHLDDPFRN
jgi:hypothetical protein